MKRSELEERMRLEYAISERVSAKSASAYLNRVVIDSRPEPRQFGLVSEQWQKDLNGNIIPALESVAGVRRDYLGPRSFWYTLGRGHDKTSSIGRLMNWVLGYSRRRLNMAVAAADADQAGLIVEAMEGELNHNPWLKKLITVRRQRVYGPGGVLKVLAANAPTTWGLNCDVVILDELTHWNNDELWKVLWSGREKRPGSVFIVITNAGVKGSWQDDLHAKAKSSTSWFVYDAPEGKQLASWMSPEAVQRMRDMLPRGLAKRVLDNKWIDPAEEADYLTRQEIQTCEGLGKDLGLVYQIGGNKITRYVAGIDYGPRRDRTALAILHFDLGKGKVFLDKLDVWQGSPDSPIRVQAVEEWIRDVNKHFYYPTLVIDPYQMEGTIQKFELSQPVERFEARGGKRTYEMAENLRSLIVNKQLVWYEGAGNLLVDGKQDTLVDEIAGLVIKPTPYGYRFDHEAGFHDDRAVAVGMAALFACRQDPSGPGVTPDPLPKPDLTPEAFHRNQKAKRPRDSAAKWGLWGTGQRKKYE